MVKGRCLCGAVKFEIEGPITAPNLCHCGMCRAMNGAPGAYTGAPVSVYRSTGEESLNWYRSSHDAERGFCRVCGSKLFWREMGGADLDVTMGSLDTPTRLALAKHVWAGHQGDYYATGHDGLPRYAESSKDSQPIPEGRGPDAGPKTLQHNGSCLCGAVKYRVNGNMHDVLVCHCGQCQHARGYAPG